MCPSSTVGQPTDDEAAIRKTIDAMTAAFNTRNEDGTRSLMTEDADFVNVLGSWSKGAAEIARARHARFVTALKNASIRIIDVRIRLIRPDVALVHVNHEMTGMLDAAGTELPPHRELSLRVVVKDRGKWLVTAFQNTTVSAPTARSS
jgi:uncharacterized protein (TIGR02246 family)